MNLNGSSNRAFLIPPQDEPMRIVQEALTFDDVLLVPAYSHVLPKDVSLQTQLTRDITLNVPLVSAAK
jgi:IMP dehydrogenase